MKIERIYIENFGKLSHFSLDLCGGLNLIFGNNEDGKTTVMSFIRLMFYGSGTQKSDLLSNLRRRFTPFSGEKMGGRIEFSHDGRDYTLTKQFGKTPRSDKTVLSVGPSGDVLPIPEGRDVGEMFFSLSAGAFERSIYIGSLPAAGDSGKDELLQKLAATVYSGDSDNAYDSIKKRLSDARLAIHTPRKVGMADRLKAQISELEGELTDSLSAEERRRVTEEKAAAGERRLSELRERRDVLKKQAETVRAAGEKAQLEAELATRRRRDALALSVGNFNKERFVRLDTVLSEIKLQTAVLKEKEGTVSQATDGAALTEARQNLNLVTEKLEKLSAERDAITRKIAEAEGELSPEKKDNRPAPAFTAAFLFAAGAVAGSFASPVFWVLLAPAVIMAVLGIGWLSAERAGEKRRQELKEQVLELKKRQLDIASRHDDMQSDFYMYSERVKLLCEDIKHGAALADRLESEKAALRQRIDALSDEFSALSGGRTADDLELLRTDCQELEKVTLVLGSSPYREWDDARISQTLSSLSTLPDCGPSAEDIQRSLAELETQLEQQSADTARLKTECEQIFKHRRGVAVLQRLLGEKREQLNRYEEHYSALGIAAEVLDEAFSQMRQNFAPELNRLTADYFKKITLGRYGDTSVTSDFAVNVRAEGELLHFESDYLSAGSRDQINLCLRMALARLTSGESRLPLMLDDVLSQYDSARTAAAVQLISDYAADTQVLFFTCHEHIKQAFALAKANVKTL